MSLAVDKSVAYKALHYEVTPEGYIRRSRDKPAKHSPLENAHLAFVYNVPGSDAYTKFNGDIRMRLLYALLFVCRHGLYDGINCAQRSEGDEDHDARVRAIDRYTTATSDLRAALRLTGNGQLADVRALSGLLTHLSETNVDKEQGPTETDVALLGDLCWDYCAEDLGSLFLNPDGKTFKEDAESLLNARTEELRHHMCKDGISDRAIKKELKKLSVDAKPHAKSVYDQLFRIWTCGAHGAPVDFDLKTKELAHGAVLTRSVVPCAVSNVLNWCALTGNKSFPFDILLKILTKLTSDLNKTL